MMKKISLSILIFTVVALSSSVRAQQNVERLDPDQTLKKLNTLMYLINSYYVDTLNMNKLTEQVVENTLKELDPHSAYIPKKDVEKANEG